MELEVLLKDLRRYPGLTRKSVIGGWAHRFTAISGDTVLEAGPGDDAGAVPMGDGYLLLAGEGLMPHLLDDPSFAGFCAVTVNVNDIYAMGGKPLGMVAVVFSEGISEDGREAFTDGMGRALEHYGVPLLGGHTSPDGGPAVAVCIAGFASKLLRGDGARPGDRLVAAVDLEGEAHPPFFAWDTVTRAAPGRTRSKLCALVDLAEMELCTACRDISNPGMLGTLAMMLESADAGAEIDLDSVPVPEGVAFDWWLKAYPSFGFVFAVAPANVAAFADVMVSRGIEWADVGTVTEGSKVVVRWRGSEALFLDLSTTPVTGL